MTTDDLQQGLPAATRRRAVRGSTRIVFAALLALASLPALAQQADAIEAAPLPSGTLSAALDSDATATATPALGARIKTILSKAATLLGTPYRWGGTSPESGFDCSGLVGYVFRTALGVELPRVSRDMATQGTPVLDRAALSPGDLVFFSLRGSVVDHVGIYVGNGQFLHAPRTGRDVTVSRLDSGYWSSHYQQGRRVTL